MHEYDLFLCHTGKDKPWVEALAVTLEREQIAGRPLKVFFDQWDIEHGAHILERIEHGLTTSRFVGIVLSPAATRAPWPRAEWQSQLFDDPLNRLGRLLPILRHKFDPETGEALDMPMLLKPIKYFDCTTPKSERREIERLLAHLRGERPTRGPASPSAGLPGAFSSIVGHRIGQEQPDAVPEQLVSNLLAVTRFPVAIFSDLSRVAKQRDVWSTLKGRRVPPFVLHEGRLYSFIAPTDVGNPFRSVLAGTNPRSERPVDWLRDEQRVRLLVWLLNDAVREHCYHLRLHTTRTDRKQFFAPVFDGRPRRFQWHASARPRTLAKVVTQTNDTALGVHYSAKMRFIALAESLYLLIEPGWMFTSDGVTPLPGEQMGVFSTKWGGRERNAAVLRNVLMWGLLLSGGERAITIDCGGDASCSLATIPAHTDMRMGIAADTISLRNILGGEGAGEQVETDDSPYADAVVDPLILGDGEGDELDVAVALRAQGRLTTAAVVTEDDVSEDDAVEAAHLVGAATHEATSSVHATNDDGESSPSSAESARVGKAAGGTPVQDTGSSGARRGTRPGRQRNELEPPTKARSQHELPL